MVFDSYRFIGRKKHRNCKFQ